jgi:transposase-like protein
MLLEISPASASLSSIPNGGEGRGEEVRFCRLPHLLFFLRRLEIRLEKHHTKKFQRAGLMQIEVPDGANHKELDKAYLLKLLDENKGNVSAVARISGWNRKTIARWIKEWGLEKRLVPKDAPARPEPPAPATTPTAARLAPETPPGPAGRDLLTPEVRAKMEAIKAAKQKRPGQTDN